MSDRDRDDARIRHPLTHDTWVIDGRTGRTKHVERAQEEGARILADSLADYPDNPDFVAAQRLAPYPRVPDTFTHERIAAAIGLARRDERELCARHIEALAIAIRDNGPKTPEGLLTALAGAQVGALLDAAAALRTGPWDAPEREIAP